MDNIANQELNLNGPWSITEEAYAQIVNVIRKKLGEPSTIVEFGSGPSSIRLAKDFPNSKIISIENNQISFEKTKSLAKQFLTQDNLELQYRSLKFEVYGGSEILSYVGTPNLEALKVDCIIIDGPSFYTLRGREACLYQVCQKLSVGGLVILDDYSRRDEKKIVSNWLAVYPHSFNLEILKIGHCLAVLQKVKSVEENWNNPTKIGDSKVVVNSYKKIRFGLLHLNDKFILGLLKFLNNFGLKADDYFQVILAMREAYDVTGDRIDSVTEAESKLTFIERLRLQFEKVQAFWEISITLLKGLLNI